MHACVCESVCVRGRLCMRCGCLTVCGDVYMRACAFNVVFMLRCLLLGRSENVCSCLLNISNAFRSL